MSHTRETHIPMNMTHLVNCITLYLIFPLFGSGCIVDSHLNDLGEPSSSIGVGEPLEVEPEDKPSIRDPDPVRDLDQDLQSCELELQWAHSSGPLFNATPRSGITTNGRVVVTHMVDSGASAESNLESDHKPFAVRVSDGEPLFQIASFDPYGLIQPQHNLSVHLESNCEDECERRRSDMSLVARSLTEDELWRVPVGEVRNNPVITMSPDGSKVIFGMCSIRRGQDVTRLQQLRSEDGVVEHEMTLEGVCLSQDFFYPSHHISSPQGRYFVAGDRYSDKIVIVDFELNRQRRIQTSANNETRLLNLSFNHDASQLITVTNKRGFTESPSAEIERWSFPDLQPLEPTSDVGVLLINPISYVRFDHSPLAFSADGVVMAHINEEGAVAIKRTSDGAILHTLEHLEFDAEGARRWGNSGSEPTHIHFNPESSAVTVQYTGGLAHFACADRTEAPEVSKPLSVVLEGPRRAEVGREVTFSAAQLDDEALLGFGFYIDGELIETPSTISQLQWRFQDAGRHEIKLQVQDGVNAGSATIWVNVEE